MTSQKIYEILLRRKNKLLIEKDKLTEEISTLKEKC